MAKLTPEDLTDENTYELLAEVEHHRVKSFVLEQITSDVRLIRVYSVYQVLMVLLLVFLLGKAAVLYHRGMSDALIQMGYAVLFSFTILIILHELIHALAYWLCGVRNLRTGAMLKKFIFYVMADREVIGFKAFQAVAFAPLVAVKLVCLVLGVLYWSTPYAYFLFSVMGIHSLFCAGDMAMLAFYKINADKEIYNFDDMDTGKSYFYSRRKRPPGSG